MKTKSLSRLVLFAALTGLLAAGCAKKPAPQTTELPAETPAAVVEPAAGEAYGVSGGALDESAVEDEAARLAAEAAAAAVATGLERVYFEFDQYVLTAEGQAALANNASYLLANPDVRVVVEGHCDERGSDEYNLALGERRARAAHDYLISLGVPSSRMSMISFGEELPLDPGHGEEAWAKNRRAEFREK